MDQHQQQAQRVAEAAKALDGSLTQPSKTSSTFHPRRFLSWFFKDPHNLLGKQSFFYLIVFKLLIMFSIVLTEISNILNTGLDREVLSLSESLSLSLTHTLSLSLSLSLNLSLCAHVCMCVCLSFCLSLCISVSLSLCICVSLSLPLKELIHYFFNTYISILLLTLSLFHVTSVLSSHS